MRLQKAPLVILLVLAGCAPEAGETRPTTALPEPAVTPTTASLHPPSDSPTGGAPPSRSFAVIAELPDPGALLLFGGATGAAGAGGLVDDTWRFDLDGGEWIRDDLVPTPQPRIGHAIEYVDSLHGAVLFGGGGPQHQLNCLQTCPPGIRGDMWLYRDTTASWTELPTDGTPGSRTGHAMAHDASSDRLVLFGGLVTTDTASESATLLGDTWAYDPETGRWAQIVSDPAPPPRAFHEMVYHAPTDSIILWGGRVADPDGDPRVWSLDVDTGMWTALEMGSTSSPSPRWEHAMAVDRLTGLVVVVGGTWFTDGGRAYGDDVWTLDPATGAWQERGSLGGPVPWGDMTELHDGGVALYVSSYLGIYSSGIDSWRWIPTE